MEDHIEIYTVWNIKSHVICYIPSVGVIGKAMGRIWVEFYILYPILIVIGYLLYILILILSTLYSHPHIHRMIGYSYST